MSYQVVNKHIDTLILNVKGKLPDGRAFSSERHED
jgi:hypothetical protein